VPSIANITSVDSREEMFQQL